MVHHNTFFLITSLMQCIGTYYSTGLNACGTTDKDSDSIVAVSMAVFDTYPGAGANPNLNPCAGFPAFPFPA
jgi:hypothetical protein